MANTPDSEMTIEALLEQRTQYEEWLAKLDSSGDKAPPAVRERVRGDYEARLQSVMEQLRGRGNSIAEELERHHASQAELDRQRRAAEEALAESEVRHAVGEYTEDEWKRVSDESRREIEQLRSQLRSVGSEITRLTQIQALISQPRTAATAAPPAPAPAAAAPPPRPAPKPQVIEEAPFVTHVADPMADPAAPPPRAPKHEPEPATANVDELTFLKSVSDEEPRSAPRRPSGPASAVSTATAPPRPAEVQTAATPVAGKAAAAVAKTLKCADCGTLNRPTEWYCERCGAELAGV